MRLLKSFYMVEDLSPIDKKVEYILSKLITSDIAGKFTTAWADNNTKYIKRILKQYTKESDVAERAFVLLMNPNKEDELILNKMTIF